MTKESFCHSSDTKSHLKRRKVIVKRPKVAMKIPNVIIQAVDRDQKS